jgi:hypothetical protein
MLRERFELVLGLPSLDGVLYSVLGLYEGDLFNFHFLGSTRGDRSKRLAAIVDDAIQERRLVGCRARSSLNSVTGWASGTLSSLFSLPRYNTTTSPGTDSGIELSL